MRTIVRRPSATPSARPRLTLALALALVLALATGSNPVAFAAGESGVVAGEARTPEPAAQARPFRLELGERNDFVAQTNFVQCVGASIQMMLNLQRPGADRSAATQRRIQDVARAWSGARPDGVERRGAGSRGWAAALTVLGAGQYRLVGAATLDEALLTAARAIRETGRPVGLLVWRGRHAWVMSGFESTGDPLTDAAARVTGATILDPLYPHGSSVWGPSPRPGARLTPGQVGRQFVPRRSSGAWARLPGAGSLQGKYVLVLPVVATPAPRRAEAVVF